MTEINFQKYLSKEDSNVFFYKIGIIGATRVGKTSIIATLLEQAQEALAQTGVSIKPFEEKDENGNLISETKRRINKTTSEIDSGLKFCNFEPTGRGTSEPFIFDLVMKITKQNQQNKQAQLRLAILDYPGGYLSNPTGQWEDCRAWIHDSSVIIVPIDSNLVMEVDNRNSYQASQTLLEVQEVKELVGDWAKARWDKQESGLLLFVPVKCETYFNDNGGREDKSEKLYEEIHDFYAKVIDAVNQEMAEKTEPTSESNGLGNLLPEIFNPKNPDYIIEYHPVDTIGCIELKNANWKQDEDGGLSSLECEYMVRNPSTSRPKRKPLGAEGILYSICEQMVKNRQNSRIFPRFWDWLGGKDKILAETIKILSKRERSSRFKQIVKGNIAKKG